MVINQKNLFDYVISWSSQLNIDDDDENDGHHQSVEIAIFSHFDPNDGGGIFSSFWHFARQWRTGGAFHSWPFIIDEPSCALPWLGFILSIYPHI